jgi:acyl-CoA synthetase (NDP forming)
LRVDTFEALFEAVQLVKGHKPPRGKRISVLTGTGGAAAMVVDRLGVLGADVVGPSPKVIAELAAKDIHVSDVPLTDIPIGRGSVRYPDILSALLASDHTDAVVSVVGSSAQNPQTIVDRVLAARPRERKPLAVFIAPRADDALLALQKNGVASFKTPETCADAVNAYLNWRAPGERPGATGEADGATRLAAAATGKRLDERDAGALFQALGIPVAEHRVVRSSADRVDLPGPFAVKLLSPDILHKTEAGMVRLDVTREDVADAAEKMLADASSRFPGARVEGVLVQQMERGLAEVIVGYRKDPEVGPIVMLGMGGITAEIAKSVTVRIAPITLATAHEMIDEVRELAVLRGFRNLPRGDIGALAQTLRAISLLAHIESRTVADAEINPLIVKEEGRGVVAVDGLVVFA